MKILFAASEATPWIKTGGLADVAGALPLALRRLGVDARLILPAYRSVLERAGEVTVRAELRLGGLTRGARLLETAGAEGLPVYLVEAPELFDRVGHPYLASDGSDWSDNGQRFAAFAHGIVELARARPSIGFAPDLVHCNDWQTGLVPALLALEAGRPRTLFSIHNLAYQGQFTRALFDRLNLPELLWSVEGVEYYGAFSFIKGGLVFADHLATVSPQYAREIQTPAFGVGLDGLLRARAAQLSGILNGIDDVAWDPSTDPYLAQRYSLDDPSGKVPCKAALQRHLGLTVDAAAPLFAHIGRLVPQKGADLLLLAMARILPETAAQLVVLGSGQSALERDLRELAGRYPGRVAVHIGFDEALAHQIEAGADAFVMPSRFEPCGLNQFYSLRYGTPPVVHQTGGLADSVYEVPPEAIALGHGNGFVFHSVAASGLDAALADALRRAIGVYTQPERWRQLMHNGMAGDYSWRRSSVAYRDLYARIIGPPS